MQSSAENIKGRVEFSVDDATRALNTLVSFLRQVGAEGQRAGREAGEGLEKVNLASAGAGRGVRSLITLFDEFERGQRGSMFATLGEAIKQAGESWAGLAAGATAAAGALYLVGENASESVHSLETQAQAVGLTAEKYGALRLAAVASGEGTEEFTVAMDRFEQAAGRAEIQMSDTARAAEELRDKQESLRIGTEEASLAADRQAIAVERAKVTIESSNEKVTDGAFKIQQLQRAYNLAAAHVVGTIDSINKVTEAQNRLSKAIVEQDINVKNARIAKEQEAATERAAQIAREKSIEAQHKQAEAFRRIGDAVTDMDKKMAETGQNASVRAAINQIFEGVGGRGSDLSRQLGEFADRWKSLGSEAQQAAVAERTFGEGWRGIKPFLDLGSQGINDLIEANQKYVWQTKQSEEAAKNFVLAQTRLQNAFRSAKNEIGTTLADLFTPAMNNLANLISDNRKRIAEFAKRVKENLDPVVTDIGRLIDSVSKAARYLSEHLHELFGNRTAEVVAFGAALAVFPTRLNAIIAILTILVPLFGKAFGNETTGYIIAFVAEIYAVYRAINMVNEAMAVLRVVSLTNPFVLLSIAAAGLATAILLLTPAADGVGRLIGKLFGQDAEKAFDDFVTSFRSAFTEFAKWLENIENWIYKYLIEPIEEVGKAIALISPNVTGTGSPSSAPIQQARGGPVPGVGSGDHVHALLEPEEYVIRRESVRKFGVNVFHALNQGLIPKFSFGGLVDRLNNIGPAPMRLQSGGLVSAATMPGAMITLVIGDRTFSGLRAPEHVAKQLVEYGRTSDIVSAGAWPGWDR